MPNRLADAQSLYLQQHADNPVDWYPWGEAAFAAAREADKPLLLSVGYSACHWCHVMAHESFADPEIATLMNELFINVKVDREERPDVDAVHMEALQAMTGHGGWPMTMFLTPDGVPFYGGTYYPPRARGGMPGFPQVLRSVAAAWRDRRHGVLDGAERLREALASIASPRASESIDARLPEVAADSLNGAFDSRHGGFGGAPKFPQAPNIAFLLDRAVREPSPVTLRAVVGTLGGMCTGGIHDQLGGGFHRYSVDAAWTVPHFEKMLYDNAQLLALYAAAWQLTGIHRLRQTAEAVAAYLLREMVAPAGAFFASTDADSEGREGAYFVWTVEQIEELLPPGEAAAAVAWYGLSEAGNFEGANVLTARRAPLAVASELGIAEEELGRRLRSARRQLLEARLRRPPPATDTKIVVGWNGLAIDALAKAGLALGRPGYIAAAVRAGEFVFERGHLPDAGLARVVYGEEAAVPGFLEDYASMAGASISLFEATGERRWFDRATALVDELDRRFGAESAFYRAQAAAAEPFLRDRELTDGPSPGGNALAAEALLRLHAITGRPELLARADEVLRSLAEVAARAPSAAGAALRVIDAGLAGYREIAVIGSDTQAIDELLAVPRSMHLPGSVVVYSLEGEADDVPLLARSAGGAQAAAFVCRNQTCLMPTRDPAELRVQLNGQAAEIDPGVTLLPDPALSTTRTTSRT